MSKFQKKPTFAEAEQFFYSKEPMRDVHYPELSEDGKTYIGDAYVLRSGDDAPMFLQNTDWIIYDENGNALFAAKDAEFREVYEPVDNDVTITVPVRYVVGLVNECDRLEAELGAMLFMTVDTSKRELATEVQRLKAEIRHQKSLVEIQVALRERGEQLRADADKFAVHVTSERWLEIVNEHTSLLADVQQLRAQLAAVPIDAIRGVMSDDPLGWQLDTVAEWLGMRVEP